MRVWCTGVIQNEEETEIKKGEKEDPTHVESNTWKALDSRDGGERKEEVNSQLIKAGACVVLGEGPTVGDLTQSNQLSRDLVPRGVSTDCTGHLKWTTVKANLSLPR